MGGTITAVSVLQFVAALFGSLAWPIAAVVLASIFRRPLLDIAARGTKFKLRFAGIVVDVSADDKKTAIEAAEKAVQKHDQSRRVSDQIRSQIADLQTVRLTRVLWVDDHPENNIYESKALLNLGFAITNVTSNEAARYCLAEAAFDLVITDIGRGSDPDNGAVLVAELHAEKPHLPVVVYTAHASKHRAGLVRAGATAVEDSPDALIGRALRMRP